MHLQERINYGYKAVIAMTLVSGLLSMLVIGALFANMHNYVEKVNAADTAVKLCRINVNAAARNIREMALNSDASSYDGYEETVVGLLDNVDGELKTLKETGVVSEELYNEYSFALSDWGNKGLAIIKEIKEGQDQQAVDDILNECTPALNTLVGIAQKLDAVTDELSEQAVNLTILCAVVGVCIIVVCLVLAILLAIRIGKRVLHTILEPLHAIENVAAELTEGNRKLTKLLQQLMKLQVRPIYLH